MPKEANTTHELRIRFDMWNKRDFEGLLARAEKQDRERAAKRKVHDSATASAGMRAGVMRSVRNGAYRKGLQKWTSSSERVPSDDELHWARTLLPVSSRDPAQRDHGLPGAEAHVHEDEELEMDHDHPQPLKGVRFGPESGPGPSGRRPEHLQAMLRCRRRRSVNRLIRALHTTEQLAYSGALPPCWHWMLRTRLVFVSKKHSTTPRPIRIGELWRRVIAKHSLHRFQGRIRQHMIQSHQYEVCVPGGAETLIHARSVLEEAIQSDSASGVWAVIDLDWANCFPSLEWDDIGQAMQDLLPEVAAWTHWCHQRAAPIDLPSGGTHAAGRGAEQGDPHGSLQCGLVLASRARAAAASLGTLPIQSHGLLPRLVRR